MDFAWANPHETAEFVLHANPPMKASPAVEVHLYDEALIAQLG